ncbi:MAG: carbohydrate binding domain-containing protein [Candidatus Omnitrophota bacterium]
MKKLNLGVTVVLVALMVLGFGIVAHSAFAADKASANNELMIADFDTGDKPNNVGGDFGAWDKDPNDETQGCKMSFEQDDAKGVAGGYSIRLDYGVDSPNPAYNGFWMKLNGEDATPYNTLNFYVKGDAKAGYTKRFKLELKDMNNKPSSYMVSGVTDQWQKISIPFEKFRKIENWNSLNEFVVVFDDINSSPKKGSILIDDISLSKQ